ncbi:MAG: FtsX-like permease family protein [Saprospiraceae bacterium]|nr:FtsX-like permease family protein [Saprospiraceae bacterium]
MKGSDAFRIFLVQIMAMGLIGSLAGVLVGSILQKVLPVVLASFLPLTEISSSISWKAGLFGLAIGLIISYLFSMIPLSQVKRVNPLNSIRELSGDIKLPRSSYFLYALIALFLFGFAFWQTKSAMSALVSILGLSLIVGILALVAFLLMKFARRFFPKRWSYEARQGLANLFRPNNQTLILAITIGLGTTIILSLFLVQELLLQQVQLTGSNNQPNTLLFDIQSDQIKELEELTLENEMPLIQSVPLVTTRIEEVNGWTKKENSELDREERRPRWVYNREFRVTYRDTLSDTESILEGAWPGKASQGKIGISISESIAEDLKAGLGDHIRFNVQGAPIETEVVSIRKINWNRLQTNFFVLFPSGVLENAPQFNVLVTRTETNEQKRNFQTAVVKGFPNVSIIDMGGILESVDSILKKLSFVIQFMAFFSLLTGLMVLISSVILSKYQRIREAVLFRTLGASGKQLLRINGYEYLFQGLLAVSTGFILSFGTAWALATFAFDMDFRPGILIPSFIGLAILVLTLLIGLNNIGVILRQSPLEVLRRE